MIGLELLVGADAFWRRAAADFARADRRLLVQAMTFEGDASGRAVAEEIAKSSARDRRVLVDAYSRLVISDRWVGWPEPLLSPELRHEVRATDAMFRNLALRGVPVRVSNPLVPLMTNYPARNHKKLIVADDVAYLGGINFSDHNFAWRDFMMRLEGPEVADFLARDFDATWSGGPRSGSWRQGELQILSLDGRSNMRFFHEIEAMIAAARREIVVLSAYLTFPYTGPLATAARRGIKVKLITPWKNNKPLVRDYLLDFAFRHGFDVKLLPDMSHLKGLLIDDEVLVIGSCNFDFVGLAAEEELVAIVRSESLIDVFRRSVISPALAEALAPGGRRVSRLAGTFAHGLLGLGDIGARAARFAPRAVRDWN